MAETTIRKINSIEGLRGILALWVLLGHTLGVAGLGEHWRGPFRIIATGSYAVEVFIIVSGFVIFYLLDVAQEGYGRFLWRRFLRLYPVYLICLLASAALLQGEIFAYTNAPWPQLALGRVQYAESSLQFFPQHLLAHLGMVHSLIPDSILPDSRYAILGQAWSLSLEWQFYLLAPLVFAALASGRCIATMTVAAVCAVNFLYVGQEGLLTKHLPMFALGIACYYLWRQPWRPDLRLLGPATVALAYLLTHSPPVVVWSAVFVAAYAHSSLGSRTLTTALESPLAVALGRLSYSIYLSHTVILLIAMLLLESVGAAAIGEWPFFISLLALTLTGTLAVSWLLYRFLETPFITLGKKASRKPVVASMALSADNH